MTQKGVSSKKLPVEPKGSRLIAQDPDDPFLTLPRELPSTPPSSSVSTSFALSWPGWITAMSVGSTSTPQQTDRSSESSWQSRSPKDCDEMATDIDVSSISSSDTFSGHSSPALAPAKTQRRQAIPISFLVHPTHVAPRISTSLSFFHPSPEASNAFSRQDNWPLFLPESKPTSDPRPSMPSPPSIRSVMAVPYMDSEGFLPDGDIPNSIAKSHDELPTVLHDLPDHAPTIGNHHLKRVPLRIYDGEHLETFKDSTDRPSVNTTTGSTNEDDEIIDHQASTKRIVSPNVKTTKTGKILHRSKKVGGSKKLTAYDRFLQQRSKYLAEHRSELTPQQVRRLSYARLNIQLRMVRRSCTWPSVKNDHWSFSSAILATTHEPPSTTSIV